MKVQLFFQKHSFLRGLKIRAIMTHFMLYGNVQSGMRSRGGKCTLKVGTFPEILLLILLKTHCRKYFSHSSRHKFPSFFFLNLSADFYTSINPGIILNEMDVYYICAISS